MRTAITDHPTAAWTAQQIIEAFPEETAPRYLVRDRDAIHSDVFRSLEKDAPTPRRIHAPTDGRVVVFPEVGGLYHRYERQAA